MNSVVLTFSVYEYHQNSQNMMLVKMNIKTNRNTDDQPKCSNRNVYYYLLPCIRVSLQITKMSEYRKLLQEGVIFLDQRKKQQDNRSG